MTRVADGALGMWPTEQRPMGVGIMVPRVYAGPNGAAPSFAQVLAIAEAAHTAGFDAIWFGDHFSWRNPDGSIAPRWDTFTMMAAIAARVPDVLLGTMVACTGYRNSGVTVKSFETLDEISGGRIICGIGAGWNTPEYEQYGYPFNHRVSRFEEAIQIIRALLREGEADFQGVYEQANHAVNRPRGPRPTGAPILIGSSGECMLGLLARYADAWNGGWVASLDDLSENMAKLERVCREHGRDPETVAKTASVYFSMRGEGAGGAKLFEGDTQARGTMLARFRDAGFRHLITAFDHCTPETVTELGDALRVLDSTETTV